MIKVYKVKRDDCDGILFSDCWVNICQEIEADMNECPEDYKKYETGDTLMCTLPKLKIGDTETFGSFTIEIIEMSKDEYNNLSEFDGW